MIQIREDLHLVSKAPPDRFAMKAGVDELDCNLLPVMFVVPFCEIDGPHASVTNLAQDPVGADASSDVRSSLSNPETSGIGCTFLQGVAIGIDAMRKQQIDLGP